MSSPVTYVPNFVSDPTEWFERLWNELDWERRPDAPRREYWTNVFGRSYTYGSGRGTRTYEFRIAHPLIQLAAEKLLAMMNVSYEGCFLNGYEGKRDWLGWHADDDPHIDHAKPIAIITLGQGRNIQFREFLEAPSEMNKRGTYGPTETMMLENGSLCLMAPGMQFTHQHRIPKADFEAKPRISLTFRGLVASLPEAGSGDTP